MILLPRIGYDAIVANSFKGSVDASQGTLTNSASIQLDDYRKLRVFGELELTGLMSTTVNFAGLERAWTYAITPRVICDRVWPASTFECGYAVTVSVAGYDNSKGITTNINLTGEDVGNTRSIRLSASHRNEIMDGAGAFVTSLGGNLDTVPDAVINDITDHYLGVAKVLSGLNPSPEPIFWEDGEGNAIAMDWCEGFMDAVKLVPETWLKLSNSPDHGHLMAPILAHLFDEHGNSLLGIPNDQLNKFLDEASIKIPDAIVGIHRFWRK